MSKGGASAPPQVNAAGLIGAQTGSNIQSAETQAGLNNANVTGPLGSSYWQPNSYDPNTGLATSYTQNQNLSGPAQNVFNNQTGLAGLLANYGQNVANLAASPALAGASIVNNAYTNLGNQIPTGPANYSGLVQLPTSATDFSNEVKQAQNAAYNAQAGYLDPQFAQKQSDLTQQLADQGITAGSSAFDRAQGDLGRQETLAYQQAQDAAVQAGNQEQQALFGENLASRQQGVNEANTQWAQPLEALAQAAQAGEGILGGVSSQLPELGSLANFTWAGGLPSQGGSPSQVTPANIAGLQSAANQGNFNSFLGGNTLNNQLLNGLGSLGGVLGGSNLLFGSQGLTGALGISPTTGLLGGLFGGGAGAGAGLGGAASDAGALGLAALGV